jgi:hypothetical protein
MLLAQLGFAADSPFEGKWEVDEKKTQAVGVPDDLKVDIEKNGNEFVLNSTFKEPKNAVYPLMWVGIMTSKLSLAADGTEKTQQIGPFMHVSKTQVNGNQMTTDFKAAMESGDVQGQWIRTVTGDGKQMTLQIKTKASDGRTMDQTLVFKRR